MGQRNIPNVCHYVHTICSLPGHYEQHFHIMRHQLQDLATLFCVNMPLPANSNKSNNLSVEKRVMEQIKQNSYDSQALMYQRSIELV